MTFPTVTRAELQVIEGILDTGRGPGFVLDFTDETFATFFREHGVDIDNPRFAQGGGSKGKRLRNFLAHTLPPLTGQVLMALLEHRAVCTDSRPASQRLAAYLAAAQRLGGNAPVSLRAHPEGPTTESALLAHPFKPDVFARLPGDARVHTILVARMKEAQTCMTHGAFLSVVILAGSVLEGMCLGFGEAGPELVNRAYTAQYRRDAPSLRDWKLHEWITVLRQMGAFSPNVEKWGHALREFRNYVHPREQLAHEFSPDEYTARITFHVVQAAAESLVRFHEGVAEANACRNAHENATIAEAQ